MLFTLICLGVVLLCFSVATGWVWGHSNGRDTAREIWQRHLNEERGSSAKERLGMTQEINVAAGAITRLENNISNLERKLQAVRDAVQ